MAKARAWLAYYYIYKQLVSYGSSPFGRLNAVIFLPELPRYSTPHTYVALIRASYSSSSAYFRLASRFSDFAQAPVLLVERQSPLWCVVHSSNQATSRSLSSTQPSCKEKRESMQCKKTVCHLQPQKVTLGQDRSKTGRVFVFDFFVPLC